MGQLGQFDYQPANYNLTGSSLSAAPSMGLLGQNWGNTNYGINTSTVDMSGFGNMVGAAGSGSSGGGGGGGGGLFGNFLGSTATDGSKSAGWGGMALGAVQGLGNMYMGMKQFGLAKDQLKSSKEQFAMNYGAQRTMTNNSINDRNVARVASREGTSNPYKSLDLVA
jgi:hypothetical protein